MTKKIYLAGPEVFLPNAADMLKAKADMARDYGFIPISPGDLAIPAAETRLLFGCNISEIDEQMMHEADAIIANLTPYRGVAADTGTSFELGFMCGLGKPVFGYTNVSKDHFQRVSDYYEGKIKQDETGRYRGSDGLSVENCEMIDNLMLHGGIIRRGGSVIVGNATEGQLYTDLEAYKACLKVAAEKLL